MKPLQTKDRPDFDIATRWHLESRPEELTEIVLNPDLIHLWCPMVFMDSEVVEPGREDGLNMTIRLYSKGFLPHSFACIAKIVDLIPHQYMAIAVRGDFEGLGQITVKPINDRFCEAHLHWRTDVRHPWIKHVKRILRPVLVWNHKWAMRRSRRFLQDEIYRRRRNLRNFSRARPTFPHNVAALRRLIRRRSQPASWDETHSPKNL